MDRVHWLRWDWATQFTKHRKGFKKHKHTLTMHSAAGAAHVHAGMQLKRCAMGLGFWALERIPANTVVLIEKPLMLPRARDSTVDAMFELIKLALERRRDAFLQLVPHVREGYQVMDYALMRDAHLRWLPHVSQGDAQLYASKYMRNAFGSAQGPALLFQGAMFNHSCSPNTLFSMQKGAFVFRTCRDVPKGQQLFDRYGHGHKDECDTAYHQRLFAQYGFRCKC